MFPDTVLMKFLLKFQALNTITLPRTSSAACSQVLMFNFFSSVDLLGLLNWRSNPEDLEQILLRLMEVEGGEIVKVNSCVQIIK